PETIGYALAQKWGTGRRCCDSLLQPRTHVEVRVRTLVYDSPAELIEETLERRRRLGQDVMDEVWEGVLHMNAAKARTDRSSATDG
ncbi:MAG: hypothetical protein ACRDSS_04610, partial [Actinocrinis sp.]